MSTSKTVTADDSRHLDELMAPDRRSQLIKLAIGLALALGLLIGVQRGWASRSSVPGSRFAGVRTYGLLGLAGGIAGSLQARAEGLATVLLAASAVLVELQLI